MALGLAAALLAAPAYAEDCRIPSKLTGASEPSHRVGFVFTGVDHERVVLSVDEAPVYQADLTTENWSTEFSGALECLMAGRYRLNVKIGDTEGELHFGVSEQTTIYISARNGVMTFSVWGPDALGLD